jgi:hypothetical protein
LKSSLSTNKKNLSDLNKYKYDGHPQINSTEQYNSKFSKYLR